MNSLRLSLLSALGFLIEFILTSNIALALPSQPSAGPENGNLNSDADHTEPYDAVIIGAGWAGLRAAKVLLNNGIQNILVLEANDYIGGRSKTVNADGSINDPTRDTSNNIEWGSEWLYIGTEKEQYLKRSNYLEGAYFDDTGDAYFVAKENAQFHLQTKLSDNSTTTRVLSDAEMDDFLRRVWGGFVSFKDNIVNRYGDVSYLAASEAYKAHYMGKNKDKQFLDLVLEALKMNEPGELHDLSVLGGDFWDGHVTKTHYMSVPGVGFGNVAAAFSSSFRNKILLNSKVTEVNYNNPGNMVISYTHNGEMKKLVSSKTVLVTASLGVLKAGTINFNPSLPDWKQTVIDDMGFGILNKAAMQWENWEDVAWQPNPYWFELITRDSGKAGKWTTFFNPTKLKGVPTLIGFISGKEARDIEMQTDEEILNDVMDHLRAMFPAIKRPDRVVITRWGQEENVLGSYTFNKVGRDIDVDSANLKRNVEGSLFFAGEATSSDPFWATTTGAWRTGEEAAVEIIQKLNS